MSSSLHYHKFENEKEEQDSKEATVLEVENEDSEEDQICCLYIILFFVSVIMLYIYHSIFNEDLRELCRLNCQRNDSTNG